MRRVSELVDGVEPYHKKHSYYSIITTYWSQQCPLELQVAPPVCLVCSLGLRFFTAEMLSYTMASVHKSLFSYKNIIACTILVAIPLLLWVRIFLPKLHILSTSTAVAKIKLQSLYSAGGSALHFLSTLPAIVLILFFKVFFAAFLFMYAHVHM